MFRKVAGMACLGVRCGSVAFLAVYCSSLEGEAAATSEVQVPRVNAAVNVTAHPDNQALAAEILQRPLFSPSRLPADAKPVEQKAEPSAPLELPGRLLGVSIRPGAREALFQRESEKPVAVHVGQKIGGWAVSAIEFDRVVLTNSQVEQVIKPTNNPAIQHSGVQAAFNAQRAAQLQQVSPARAAATGYSQFPPLAAPRSYRESFSNPRAERPIRAERM